MTFVLPKPLLMLSGALCLALLVLLQPTPAHAADGITAPTADAVLSGVVEVRGTADHPTFRKWQIDLIVAGDEDHATFLALDEKPVTNGDFFAWDTTLYPDGDHQLRLRVVHSNLNYDEYFVPVTLDNGNPAPPVEIAPASEPVVEIAPPAELTVATPPANADRWIQVDISDQRLLAYENGNVVFDYTVSTGKPGFRTLPGSFNVYRMYEETRMRGYDYDTPDVPWTMYYSGGFAIHGAYWHENFGTPVSHGCVNLPVEQAKALYEWADMGIPVVVTE